MIFFPEEKLGGTQARISQLQLNMDMLNNLELLPDIIFSKDAEASARSTKHALIRFAQDTRLHINRKKKKSQVTLYLQC